MFTVLIVGIYLNGNCQDGFRTPRFRSQSYNHFKQLDSTGMILIPIAWENNAKFKDIKIIGENQTKNILFYNPINDNNKLLFEDSTQIISKFSGHLLYKKSRTDTTPRPPNKNHLYYEVINYDYNGDKKLDDQDPTYLYYSHFDGSGLTLLTPKFYHLKNHQYFKENNIILATLVLDENLDKKYNNNDTEILYKIDLNDLAQSKIISKLKLKSKKNN